MKSTTAKESGFMLALIVSILLSLVMGLCLVWLSIESTDNAYTIGQMHADLAERTALEAKLKVERDRLLSPYELGLAAASLGMREALPGQIRRMGDLAKIKH